MKTWRKGDEVYSRRNDFFGDCLADEKDGTVMVKWQWPQDPKSPPEETQASSLQDANEVQDRYG